jgi:hypothetical protein
VLVDFLRANAEVFAWSPSDMPGIPRDVAEHSLDIWAGARPVRQPLRWFDEEKRRAIGEEIHKLMAVGFIKEVFHPEWLANPVLVKKKGGKWRMCVDYTGLNKACPKVPYPLPRINQIVDSTTGCETLSFLDAYSGYHQIRMKESDQLATSFITPFGMYCYITMPFGLRNAGATYQRCMNHVFGEHIGRTVEAYVDDICRRFEPGGSLDRRVNCRRVPQPRWVGARRSEKEGRSQREIGVKGETHGLRVCPAPRSGALVVGGYKRPHGREQEAYASVVPFFPARPTLCKRALDLPFIGVRRGSRCTMGGVAVC